MSSVPVCLEISIRTEFPADHDVVATDRTVGSPWRGPRLRTLCQVVAVLAVLAVLVIAGAAVLPEAWPNLTQAMSQSPFTPLLVAACWLAATTAAIIGKRIITAGCLTWRCTATVHVSGTVANRVVPAGAGAAGAYLVAMRRGGMTTAAAAGVVALWAVAGALAHGSGLILGMIWLRGGELALAAAVLVIAASIVGGYRLSRRARHRGSVPVTQRLILLQPAAWQPRTRLGRAVRHHAINVRATAADVISMARARPFLAAAAVLAQLTAMICLAVGFAAAAMSLGVPVSATAAMAAYVAGIAVATTTPTPAGIGSAEAALVGALVVAGATVGQALPAVLVFRAVILLAPVAAALAMAGAWSIIRGKSRLAQTSIVTDAVARLQAATVVPASPPRHRGVIDISHPAAE
jgi:uncharacterized membrane protein YbhN (UPF0104 family)